MNYTNFVCSWRGSAMVPSTNTPWPLYPLSSPSFLPQLHNMFSPYSPTLSFMSKQCARYPFLVILPSRSQFPNGPFFRISSAACFNAKHYKQSSILMNPGNYDWVISSFYTHINSFSCLIFTHILIFIHLHSVKSVFLTPWKKIERERLKLCFPLFAFPLVSYLPFLFQALSPQCKRPRAFWPFYLVSPSPLEPLWMYSFASALLSSWYLVRCAPAVSQTRGGDCKQGLFSLLWVV